MSMRRSRPLMTQQAGEGQAGSGDGNQQGAGTGDQNQGSLGLLNAEADAGDGQNAGDGGSGNQTGAVTPGVLTAESVAQIVDSTFDRRVNVILREIRGQNGQGGQQGNNNGQNGNQSQSGQQGQQGSNGNQQTQHTPTGPDAGDAREARSTYREFVSDQITFLSTEEREVALNLANALIADSLAEGTDSVRAGRDVARTVASNIKALRNHYEARTIAALKAKGLLPKDTGAGQQVVAGAQQVGAPASYAAGANKAQEMYAGRQEQRDRVTPKA